MTNPIKTYEATVSLHWYVDAPSMAEAERIATKMLRPLREVVDGNIDSFDIEGEED